MSDLIVLSGGTQGLGRALSLEFGRAGYRVRALFHANQRAAADLEADFASAAIDGVCIQMDIGAPITDLEARLGGEATILLHSACPPFSPQPFHTLVWDQVSRHLDVGVRGAFQLYQQVIPGMVRRRRGTIVSILTSALYDAAPKGMGMYLPAKHAIVGLNRTVAAEYGTRGVRCFSVSPGFMDTALTASWRVRPPGVAHSPADVAADIRALVQDSAVPGRGEDYQIPRRAYVLTDISE